MSEELNDFSEQIDEQFEIADIADIESEDFWQAIVNLFIWFLQFFLLIIFLRMNASFCLNIPLVLIA